MQKNQKISVNTENNNILEDEKYIEILYSDKRRAPSDYPNKLAKHLVDNYYFDTGNILDIGCGRGDLLKAFHKIGFLVAGTDISPASIKKCEPHLVKTSDLLKESLPFDEGEFNYVFSKSVIEHLHNPMALLTEALRVLEKDGKAVIMTPSWMHTAWGPFYLDYTHVTPFTKPSLRDAMEMAGFRDVEVFHFYQLPFLWRWPRLKLLVKIFGKLPLRYRPMFDTNMPLELNKLIQFSKEVMLLGVGRK
jgi:SAM-dependent methyltransferase